MRALSQKLILLLALRVGASQRGWLVLSLSPPSAHTHTIALTHPAGCCPCRSRHHAGRRGRHNRRLCSGCFAGGDQVRGQRLCGGRRNVHGVVPASQSVGRSGGRTGSSSSSSSKWTADNWAATAAPAAGQCAGCASSLTGLTCQTTLPAGLWRHGHRRLAHQRQRGRRCQRRDLGRPESVRPLAAVMQTLACMRALTTQALHHHSLGWHPPLLPVCRHCSGDCPDIGHRHQRRQHGHCHGGFSGRRRCLQWRFGGSGSGICCKGGFRWWWGQTGSCGCAVVLTGPILLPPPAGHRVGHRDSNCQRNWRVLPWGA